MAASTNDTDHCIHLTLHKKCFPLTISSVNVTKSAAKHFSCIVIIEAVAQTCSVKNVFLEISQN